MQRLAPSSFSPHSPRDWRGGLSRKCAEEKCIILRRSLAAARLARPAEFSDRDNDDDVFIFSAPLKSKPQRKKPEKGENSARVICISFSLACGLNGGESERVSNTRSPAMRRLSPGRRSASCRPGNCSKLNSNRKERSRREKAKEGIEPRADENCRRRRRCRFCSGASDAV